MTKDFKYYITEEDNGACVWDGDTGECVGTFKGKGSSEEAKDYMDDLLIMDLYELESMEELEEFLDIFHPKSKKDLINGFEDSRKKGGYIPL